MELSMMSVIDFTVRIMVTCVSHVFHISVCWVCVAPPASQDRRAMIPTWGRYCLATCLATCLTTWALLSRAGCHAPI